MKEYREIYVILVVSLLLILAPIFLNISIFYGLFSAVVFALIILSRKGTSLKYLLKTILAGLNECKTVFIVVLLMGATISIWLASGIVPSMIYYGLKHINNINFLLASFLITSVVSIFMGTPVGTISTIGIALLGVGKGLSIPLNMILGAIVSGAFLADKASPISALTNLALNVIDMDYKKYLKTMLKTIVPTFIITSVFFYIMGKPYSNALDFSKINSYQEIIKGTYYISPYFLLIPLGTIILSGVGVQVITTMLIGVGIGSFICYFYQGMGIKSIVYSIFMGYGGPEIVNELSHIFKGGGIIHMVEVVLVIGAAVSLSSIFEKTNIIAPIIDKLFRGTKSKGILTIKTGILSSLLTIITCDQSVGIILPGRLLQPIYDRMGISKYILGRTISDTGTIIAPLLPFNVNSLLITTFTGIATKEYAPYAILCYVFPIITILLGFISNKKKGDIKNEKLCDKISTSNR